MFVQNICAKYVCKMIEMWFLRNCIAEGYPRNMIKKWNIVLIQLQKFCPQRRSCLKTIPLSMLSEISK